MKVSMTGDDKVVGFPVSTEERARRLQVEVERLARLPVVEWMYYLEIGDVAKKHDIEPAKLKAMIGATIKAAEKKARQEQAEERQREQRAERQRSRARREDERKQREEKREWERAEREAERGEREKEKALAAILKLPTGEHEAKLAELAKRLGEDIELLRDEFSLIVDSEEKAKIGETELWPEPVNLSELLTELQMQIARYIVIHEESAAVATVLWVCFAWSHEAVTYSPILVVQGADANTAKSLLCHVLVLLTPRAHMIAEPTGPSLYRFVDRWHPTLIVDDADKLLPRRPDLTSIVNASWIRGTTVPRTGPHGEVFEYDPFCPKILNGVDVLAALSKETQTRCITVQMWPKLPGEEVINFKFAARDERFAVLRRKLARFAADHMVKLADTNPPLPESFNNRLQMNWELLLATADLAGGAWPQQARAAAIKLSSEREEPSQGKRLLRAFQIMFAQHGSLLTSKQVEESLPAIDEEWGNYKGRGRAINRWEVAVLLRPYGIKPGVIHPRGRPADRGYDESWFGGNARPAAAHHWHLQRRHYGHRAKARRAMRREAHGVGPPLQR
jgi:putative DNA primase/helicase